MKKRILFAIIAAIIIGGYVIALQFWEASSLSNVITTALALVAGVTFWIEYSNNSELNEAAFLIELNNQFICNKDFNKVEWELEKYYAAFLEKKNDPERDRAFKEKFALEKEDRQCLINYLVHLEGIAALVCSGQLRLRQISNLMAFRYFIAVNNPIVQELEILPAQYREHYKGIIKLYPKWEDHLSGPKWTKHLNRKKTSIPMDTYSLNKKI